MIINEAAGLSAFLNSENISVHGKERQKAFSSTLSDIVSEKALSGGLPSEDTDIEDIPRDCALGKAAEEADDGEAEETADAKKDMFTICFECEDKENCAHWLGMTGAKDNEKGFVFLSPTSKGANVFRRKDTSLRESLQKLTYGSVVYNYNIISPETDRKVKRYR